MKKNLCYFLTVILGVFGLLLFAKPIVANASSGAGFTVSAVIPDNQYTKSATYFDLKVSPNQTQTVYVNVSNLTNKTKTITAYPNTAYTSDSGSEAYNKNKLTGLSSAPYLLSDIFGEPQKVTVGPKATKQVAFTLTMPAKSYKGILEGAFYFLDSSTSSAQATNQKGMSIKNRFALALGVVLREDTSTIVSPHLKMNAIKPSISDTSNFSPAVKVNLENTRATMITNMSIKAQISRTKGGTVLYKSTQKNMGMAPNSNFNYSIDWNNNALKAGKYHLHLVARSGTFKWVFDRNFTITTKQANKVNKKANVVRNWTWLWITIGVIVLLLIILITFLLGRRAGKRKDNKEIETKEEKED
ncbi:DUF916 and DUF3324 domain-containing protein [Ligilactobacillus sp. WILCCON 0076]|uniref:DUF916 and DUF3324 domain-containing protein n=1 Tax=Ligilactobacillus ubinensis TaxID=2876789 RepID=A0A9X2FQ23_9LACO|nr:DUF916 and DUF3324 domain-containing protein [Ligilactobacillus ubinensis]MCP0887448.1 DUF916 and DUF3324 domain-containing protein [Ligilactobacillus ubinensis]